MSKLFSSFSIKEITFKNRLVISPMCQYSSIDGFASNWHLVHLGSRAVGGAGLIMQEATAISPEGRITFKDLGIWKDEHKSKLQEIVSFIHQNDAKIGIQIAHAGRKASHEVPWKGGDAISSDSENGWSTLAPSALPFKAGSLVPNEMSIEEIKATVANFVSAAQRAKEVGYDVLEIHAAHGYLIHEFYSPLSNKRQDQYGGSFQNRIRLLLEVVEQVLPVWGSDKPLFVRISATDWVDHGWTIDDSIELAKILKSKGVDLIDTSSGGNILTKIPSDVNYQVDLSERIKKEADIYTGAVGLIQEAAQAEEILAKEKADLVFIARESLRNPYFGLNANKELTGKVEAPQQYRRAF